jgi:Lon-like protease
LNVRLSRTSERNAVTLFADGGEQPLDESESERIKPRRRVVVGWVFLAAAFVLVLILALLPAPYVIEQPGPVFNTLGHNQPVGSRPSSSSEPLISIPDKTTFPTAGALDLLTVSVVGNPQQLPSWLEVASAWFSPSKAVSPVQELFPAGLTNEENNKENQTLMVNSQQDAIAAALNELGYSFPQLVKVMQVIKGTPAYGVMKTGDEIVTVNGKSVPGIASLRTALQTSGAGKPAELGIIRDGNPLTVSITPESSHGAVVLGVGVGMDYTFPFTVKIQLNDVGGPSAGQMFALGIIDKLSPGKLNGGERVAGTGTIDNEGNIGAIGGIRQKMYGARAAGARWFLAPASNCNEVTGHIPSGLKVFSVKTLDDSLAVLRAISSGGSTSSLPTCPAN